jgi:hypothetical protein
MIMGPYKLKGFYVPVLFSLFLCTGCTRDDTTPAVTDYRDQFCGKYWMRRISFSNISGSYQIEDTLWDTLIVSKRPSPDTTFIGFGPDPDTTHIIPVTVEGTFDYRLWLAVSYDYKGSFILPDSLVYTYTYTHLGFYMGYYAAGKRM